MSVDISAFSRLKKISIFAIKKWLVMMCGRNMNVYTKGVTTRVTAVEKKLHEESAVTKKANHIN